MDYSGYLDGWKLQLCHLHPLQQESRKVPVEVSMVFEDKALECQSCGGKFMFSSGEQKFFNAIIVIWFI